MNDEQIKQRISYLVEHGGLWEDPIADLRRDARRALWLAASALVLLIVDVTVAFLT